MLTIERIGLRDSLKRFSEDLRRKILWIDERCYRRDARFNEDTLDTFLDEHATLYMVLRKGVYATAVGYMLLYAEEEVCYLTSMAILKTYRNAGIGKKLFKIFLNEGKKYSRMQLHAVNPAMIHIAECNGFRKVRTNKEYFGKVDCILMEKNNGGKK